MTFMARKKKQEKVGPDIRRIHASLRGHKQLASIKYTMIWRLLKKRYLDST